MKLDLNLYRGIIEDCNNRECYIVRCSLISPNTNKRRSL
nr:MAG TPA: hypothetical protein [Caudoviricetes sp.]